MYYLIKGLKRNFTYLAVITILFYTISLFTFHSNIFADIAILNKEAENYRIQGYEEQQKGNFDKALNSYTKALSLGLEDAAVYNDVGVVYEQLGVAGRAEEMYLQAIRLDKNYLPPYTNLAYLYESQRDTPKAIEYFKERLSRAPDNDPWREQVKKELNRLQPEVNQQLEKEAAQKKQEQLKEEFRKKAREDLQLQIVRSEHHFLLGQSFLSEKKFDDAIIEFNRALSVTPDNPKVLKARDETMYTMKVEEIQKRTEDAIENLHLGEVESAKKEFQKILTLIPDDSIINPNK